MRRVVIDTSLYIDWLNAGRPAGVLFQRDAVKYLSAVVVLELYAGAFSPRDRRVVRGVVVAFDRADRLLVPSGAVYEDAGHVLRVLQESRGSQVAGSSSLVNDVLIALSARSIGATVVTSNARDFAAIRRDSAIQADRRAGVRALIRSPMPFAAVPLPATGERLNEEFRRRVQTQGSLPTEDAALIPALQPGRPRADQAAEDRWARDDRDRHQKRRRRAA